MYPGGRGGNRCLPLPEVVAERLQRGEGLEGLENLQHEQLGSYCVRCCVWRPNPGKLITSDALPEDCDTSDCDTVCQTGPHHCSTCGRCVRHFDQCALAAAAARPPAPPPPRSPSKPTPIARPARAPLPRLRAPLLLAAA